MPEVIRRFAADEAALRRFYGEPLSEFRLERLARFLDRWEEGLAGMKPGPRVADAIDHRLLGNHIARRRDELRLQRARNAETLTLLPFAKDLIALEAARRRSGPVDAEAAAATLDAVRKQIEEVRNRVSSGRAKHPADDALSPTPVVAFRASEAIGRLKKMLGAWFRYRDGFEPKFGWWVRKPHAALAKALDDYAGYLRGSIAGVSSTPGAVAPLIGDPIGRDALCRALAREMIPYSPEQLLVIAKKEFAWCEAQGRKASKELGLDGTWKAAVEHVKTLHQPPGKQDDLVTAQAKEAIRFLEDRDLVTVPPLAAETWRLKMLTEREQKTLPFAVYHDQHMLVAYATEHMEHCAKCQAMRGNNEHFTRIVTPHELIPGHHLQLFMAARYRDDRKLFRTPFFVEGWALHWEMLLWDLGWHRGPADRVGMLFWRMHRCARILVTLAFHLGEMTPKEMVAFLHERVGLEEDGATGEVRRYIAGAYGPLYQAAYMLGGLQLRALHHELVGGGTMSNRAFHDAVLRQGSIPFALVRAALRGEKPTDASVAWRFAGDVKAEGGKPCPR